MKGFVTDVIDTTKEIGDLVDWLVSHHASSDRYQIEPTMYIDPEGVNLCRDGSLSIFTLLIDTGIPIGRVHLIDVHSLGSKVFNTRGIKGKSLKDILEDKQIPKAFFDVRNNSDACSHILVWLCKALRTYSLWRALREQRRVLGNG
jgi:exonuclease 3'-5' domain-containing protein 1